jgi:hypothetical protein
MGEGQVVLKKEVALTDGINKVVATATSTSTAATTPKPPTATVTTTATR